MTMPKHDYYLPHTLDNLREQALAVYNDPATSPAMKHEAFLTLRQIRNQQREMAKEERRKPVRFSFTRHA